MMCCVMSIEVLSSTVVLIRGQVSQTDHPVGPSSAGHVAHPEEDQMLDPRAAGVVGQVQQVEVKGEVALFNLRGAIVHHGLAHLFLIIRLGHHEPVGSRSLFCVPVVLYTTALLHHHVCA